MLLDRYLPVYHYHEKHSIDVRAPRDAVYRAIREVKYGDVPALRLLFGIRMLPAWLAGKVKTGASGGDEPFIKRMMRYGFMLLEEAEGQELLVGVVGPFWRPVGNEPIRLDSVQAFIDCDSLRHAKAVMNFQVREQPNGIMTVFTETRILTQDKSVRLKFGLYWLLIYPGSALIRRGLLRAIKANAEKERVVYGSQT
ncbi:hypothetical protein YDYSG_42580 [Paenibacillus tyrfis]|uniref:hypothetical protein n=1 Tax=Paenibacillus tyrfis TaxID=1501230 RepID=UPI002490C780|nr:hypothetical protein [Paenibacillus tyrfis]GLI08228.1 hypothetical protein YDYSG_42580 [Paenibacillus tyrfis]